MSTRPQRSTANRNPAAPVLEAKQTRRSTEEVAHDKAKIEAKKRALLKRNEDNLRKLQELQRDLDAQEKENATHAARPPPEQPVTGDKQTPGVPLAPLPVKVYRPSRSASKADGRAAIDDDSSDDAAPIGQRVQPGRAKRLRREDLEAFDGSKTSSAAVTPVATATVNVDKTPNHANTKAKKRKSEGLGEDKPAKKGKQTRPSGPTSAAAAKFALPLTATRTSSTPHPPSLSASSAVNTVPPKGLPQGVFVKDVGGFELDNGDAGTTKHDSDGVIEAAAESKSINLQLEVVDVAANPVPAASTPAPVGGAGVYAVTSSATPKGGWSMRQLEPMLGSFSGTFTHIFTPKLINFVFNTASGPWKLTGVNLVDAMKDLAAQSFPPELVIYIAPRQPFYEVAKQKLSEYRNGVSNEAVDVVNRYMQSRRFSSAEARAEYVEWATCAANGFLFRYERVSQGDDGKTLKKRGLYQSTLIAETFVYHLNRIGKSGDQIRDTPCNALALTAVAVERALKMWRTGSYVAPPSRTEEGKFSDKAWGASAQQYLEGITNLTEEKWDKILGKADKARRGYNVDSEDELDELDEFDEREDIPLIGRAGIDDDDDDDDDVDDDVEDENECQEMEGVEQAGDAIN